VHNARALLEAGRAGGGTVGAWLGWAASLAGNCGNSIPPKVAHCEAMKNKKKNKKSNVQSSIQQHTQQGASN
jgi:hypothetical protein